MSTPASNALQVSTSNEIPFSDTVARSAQRFGLSEWTIRQLANEGKIRARYHGRRVLIIQQSLRAYVESLPDER
jgi:excisionase family DNA binding protein